MREIGGFFELELKNGNEYHINAIKLNTGRNCLEYILMNKKYKKIYIPYYTCDVLLEPINKLNISYEFYYIDEKLEPIFDKIIKPDEVFLYTNYFGLKNRKVKELSQKYSNLIIDNCQSFYSKPINHIDTFYSPRKFFGVSDGGYLYTDMKNDSVLQKDSSIGRFEHIIGRIERSADEFYTAFKRSESLLDRQPIMQMSNLTQSILKSINYDASSCIRINNYNFLHNALKDINKLKINIEEDGVPMVYPFLINNGSDLKRKLIKEKIYIASYWPNVKEWLNGEICLESNLQDNLVPLPIDQRLTNEDLNRIINNIIND